MVTPLGRVLHIQEYQNGSARSGIVFVEVPKRLRRKNQKNIETRLGRDAKFISQLKARVCCATMHSCIRF